MRECCVCGNPHTQWHHNFEYGRKAVNEAWCILPLCPTHHAMVREIKFRRLIDWAMYNRATNEELKQYSRVMNYVVKRGWYNQLFGTFTPEKLRQHYANNYHLHKTNLGQSTVSR